MVFKKKIEWRRRDQITVQVERSRAVLSSWGRHRLATIISKGHACYATQHWSEGEVTTPGPSCLVEGSAYQYHQFPGRQLSLNRRNADWFERKSDPHDITKGSPWPPTPLALLAEALERTEQCTFALHASTSSSVSTVSLSLSHQLQLCSSGRWFRELNNGGYFLLAARLSLVVFACNT